MNVNRSLLKLKKSLYELKKGRFRVGADCLPTERREEGLRNFFVHIHLPKTGGSTFNALLARSFGRRFEPFAGRFIDVYPRLSPEQVLEFIERYPGIDAVASHNFQAVLPYRTSPKRIVGIAFVRDPVDRFFSNYFHQRGRFGNDRPEERMLLDAYIDFQVERCGRRMTTLKGYLHLLTGRESQGAYEYVARLVEEDHLYLFSTYEMADALRTLRRSFPGEFQVSDFEKKNISPKDQEVTETHRARVAQIISPYDWKIMDLAEGARADR